MVELESLLQRKQREHAYAFRSRFVRFHIPDQLVSNEQKVIEVGLDVLLGRHVFDPVAKVEMNSVRGHVGLVQARTDEPLDHVAFYRQVQLQHSLDPIEHVVLEVIVTCRCHLVREFSDQKT